MISVSEETADPRQSDEIGEVVDRARFELAASTMPR